MSDTPRTAAEFAKKRTFPAGFTELYDFSCQLELELNEANRRYEQCEKETCFAIERTAKAEAQLAQMRKALDGILNRYTRLVNSGDAGFWDPEEEPEVIAARLALSSAAGKDYVHRSEVEKAYFEAKSDAHLTVERHFATSRARRVAKGEQV